MTRPRSIAIIEIAYLAALAITIAGPFLIWPALTASVTAQAQAGPAAGGIIAGVLIAVILIAAAIGLLFWWLVARRGSTIARWITVLLLGYTLVSNALGLAQAEGAFDVARIVTLLGMVFTAVALASLLMPDAGAWFAEEPETLA